MILTRQCLKCEKVLKIYFKLIRERAKIFLMAIKRGAKGLPLRRNFFGGGTSFYCWKVPTAIKLQGGGGKALMALPLRKELF